MKKQHGSMIRFALVRLGSLMEKVSKLESYQHMKRWKKRYMLIWIWLKFLQKLGRLFVV